MKPVTLNDLLFKQEINPERVVVMRHRPKEPGLRKVFPWLAGERPSLFNAYQQAHGTKVQTAMEKMIGDGFLASFIGMSAGEAVFAGLYRISAAKEVKFEQFWKIPENIELAGFGMTGWKKEDSANRTLWFDLKLMPLYKEWRGKLTISWPPPERSWFRRAERNEMPILSISEESRFVEQMPAWQDIMLSWAELRAIPSSWQTALKHWRGIYFIRDISDGKDYVGSASGSENLLGRWRNYADGGDGGNKYLRGRRPENFRFSILQIVAHDLNVEEVVGIENSWKKRLHTIAPLGLNVS